MLRNLALFGVVATLAAPALAQSASLQDVVAGKDTPLSLHLKDLNPDWKRVSITTQGAGGSMSDLMSQIMPLAMMGGSGPKGKDDMMGMAVFSSMFSGGSQPVYYTKGQTTAIGGETFLVAYKFDKPQLDFMQLMMESEKNGGKEPDFAKLMAGSKLTPDSALTLSLVNVRSINTLAGIRAFDMNQEISESAKGPGGLLDLMMLGKTSTVESKPAPAVESVTAPAPAGIPTPPKPKAPAKKGPGK